MQENNLLSKPDEILIATNNPGKVEEMRGLLKGFPLKLRGLSEFGQIPEPIEDGSTFEANAILKARYYSKKTGLWSLADDSGLAVDALGDAPGIYSARYAGENATSLQRIEKLLSEIKHVPRVERGARFVAVMALADPQGEIITTAEGICSGMIADIPKGTGGFGYDPIFIPAEYDQTFGELSPEIKDLISHRSLAINKIITFLRGFMGL